MQYRIGTNFKPCSVKITVQANKPCTVWIEAYDPTQANTFYTKRYWQFLNTEPQTFYVQMPVVGKSVMVSISEKEADVSSAYGNFTVKEIKRVGLPRRMHIAKMQAASVRHFVRFCQRFSFNAGILPTYEDRYYKSAKGDFLIHYLPTIIAGNGEEHLTPARINTETKIIQVSKAKFIALTIPQRICILLHEFSHEFRNEDEDNELEADINGLIIYLGLGYPRIEAKQTFLSIFMQSPTPENIKRYKHIEQFIDQYEHLNFAHL